MNLLVKLLALVDLGTVNQEIANIAGPHSTSDVQADSMATHMCAFMLRGIFMNLLFPMAHYPTQSVTVTCYTPLYGNWLELWKSLE